MKGAWHLLQYENVLGARCDLGNDCVAVKVGGTSARGPLPEACILRTKDSQIPSIGPVGICRIDDRQAFGPSRLLSTPSVKTFA